LGIGYAPVGTCLSGKFLAAASVVRPTHGNAADREGPGVVRMWDATTGKLCWEKEEETGGATSVAFAPDGKTVVSAGYDSAMVRHDRDLAPRADVHPASEVTYPGKAGAEPIHVKFLLEQRCCNVRFYATLRTPAEAGLGKAALTLSFPGWSDVKVAPVTKELAVGDAPRPR
jgi:hypothetical protein